MKDKIKQGEKVKRKGNSMKDYALLNDIYKDAIYTKEVEMNSNYFFKPEKSLVDEIRNGRVIR